MADVAHTSIGYTGSVDQVAEARRFQIATLPFRVASPSDWAVTAVTSSTRTVQIAAGLGQAYGVRDTTASAATLTLAANTGSTIRYDLVVATFNWAAGTPATSFQVISGSTTTPAVNTGGTAVAGQINRVPGVQYDALLAVVPVAVGAGSFAATDVVDARVWSGQAGPLGIANATYLSLVDVPVYAQAIAANTGQPYSFNGTAWTSSITTFAGQLATTTSTSSTSTSDTGCTVLLPVGVFAVDLVATGTSITDPLGVGLRFASGAGSGTLSGTVSFGGNTSRRSVNVGDTPTGISGTSPAITITGLVTVTTAGSLTVTFASTTGGSAASLSTAFLRAIKVP